MWDEDVMEEYEWNNKLHMHDLTIIDDMIQSYDANAFCSRNLKLKGGSPQSTDGSWHVWLKCVWRYHTSMFQLKSRDRVHPGW